MKGIAGRASWGLLDQVLSSATNFALSIFVAATVSPRQFGAFSVVYGAYGLCLGLSAGIASTPLIVRFSTATGPSLRRAERASVGTALAVGLVGCGISLAAAPFLGATVTPALRALGLMLPGLLVQDAWRFAFMARGRPALAATNDGVWTVLQVIGTLALLKADAVSATSMILVWGGAATCAALVGCVQAGAWPAVTKTGAWLREQRDLGPRYAVESIAHRSGAWLAIAAVGAIAGLPAVAGLRGAFLLVTGPLNLLFVGAAFVAVPEAVRLYKESPDRLPGVTRVISWSITAIAAGWCAVVLTLADRFGPQLLGSTWPLAKPLLLVLAAFALAQALAIGPAQGLWALGAARESVRTQLANVTLMLITTSLGAVLDGARGAAIGLVATSIGSTLLWWWQFRAAFDRATAVRRVGVGLGSPPEPPSSDLTVA